MLKQNKISILRFLTQLIFLILFVAALIPYKVFFILVIITAVLLGPFYCGWFCTFGAFQDSLRYLGRFIKKEPIQFPDNAHRVLKYARYVGFIGALIVGGFFLFPDKISETYRHLITGHLEISVALYSLAILAVLSLFTERFFCRYLCTYGANLGIYSLFRVITINKNESCTSCKLCSKKCPMHIEVDKVTSLVNPNCINCLKCVECCPSNSLNMGIRKQLKP